MTEEAERLLLEVERIFSLPAAESYLLRVENFRLLAETLRRTLDFHNGFETELPRFISLVASVFETLQEHAPGRWQIKRLMVVEFQKRIHTLATYLRESVH